jgi:hypothetical protein
VFAIRFSDVYILGADACIGIRRDVKYMLRFEEPSISTTWYREAEKHPWMLLRLQEFTTITSALIN